MDEFLKAIHDAVIDAGAKDLARQMGVGHVSLLQRTNPNNDAHRLNVEHLFQILVHSKDMRPLQCLAAEFGYELVAKDPAGARPLTTAMLNLSAETGDVTRLVADAIEDGKVTQLERGQICREIADVRKSLDVLEASVKVA